MTKRLWDRRFRMMNTYLKFDPSLKTKTRNEIINMKKVSDRFKNRLVNHCVSV